MHFSFIITQSESKIVSNVYWQEIHEDFIIFDIDWNAFVHIFYWIDRKQEKKSTELQSDQSNRDR